MKKLSVTDLTFKWGNDSSFEIGPVSFEATEGNIVGLYGRSGTGKSTLMRVLLNELAQSSGKITTLPNSKTIYHDQIQKTIPWLTAKNNVFINYKKHENHSNKDTLLKDFDITNFQNLNAVKLSGGQRAKVALARTLCESADIILLDEPFTGVDLASQKYLINSIKSYTSQSIVVFTSHDPSLLVQLCDFVLCLVENESSNNFRSKIFNLDIDFEGLNPTERKNSEKYSSTIKELTGVLYE